MPLTKKLASKSLIKQNTNQDTVGTGVTNLTRDAFTGNGVQTVFTLTAAPLSAANTQVFISGVYQNKNTYTISGTTLTFSTPPPSAASVEVMSGTNYSIGVPGDGTVTNAKLASSSVTNDKMAALSVSQSNRILRSNPGSSSTTLGDVVSSSTGPSTAITSTSLISLLSVSLTTNGNPVIVNFAPSSLYSLISPVGNHTEFSNATASTINLSLYVNGSAQNKITFTLTAGQGYPLSIQMPVFASAGSNTFAIYASTSAGTLNIFNYTLSAYEMF